MRTTFRSFSSLLITLAAMAGVGAYQARALKTADEELVHLQNTADVLQHELAVARASRVKSADDLAAARSAAATASPLVSTGDTAFDEEGRDLLRRVYALRKRIDHDPTEWIPEIRHARDADWFEAVTSVSPWTDQSLPFAAASLRRSAQMTFLAAVERALEQYTEEHNGMLPKNTSELAPYFASPSVGDGLSRYEIVASGRWRDVLDDHPILEEKMSPTERERAEMTTVNDLKVRLKEFQPTTGSESLANWRRSRAIFDAISSYQKKHDGLQPTETQQLRPYISDPAMLEGVELEEDGFSIKQPQ